MWPVRRFANGFVLIDDSGAEVAQFLRINSDWQVSRACGLLMFGQEMGFLAKLIFSSNTFFEFGYSFR